MTGSANPMAARAARAVLKLLWITAKVIVSLVAFIVIVFLLALLVPVLTGAIGLSDYRTEVGAVLLLPASVALVFVLLRWNLGKKVWIKPGGPWTDAHTLNLRRTVQEELSRHRNEPPSPHP